MPAEPVDPPRFSKVAETLISDLRGLPSDDPARARRRPTKSLATLVEELLQKHKVGREAPEHTIRENWPAIVGSANATYSHPVVIERNRLIVPHCWDSGIGIAAAAHYCAATPICPFF